MNRSSYRMQGLLPLPTELGFTRVRHMDRSKSETSDFDWGEGWSEGVAATENIEPLLGHIEDERV